MPPTEYWLEFHGGRLTLFYTLPLKKPVAIHGKATLEVFDPEYFVAFTFPEHKAVTLTDAPPGCKAAYHPPHMLDAKTMAKLSAVPVDQHDLPPELQDAAAGLANLIALDCPGEASGSAVNPFEAVMADAAGQAGWRDTAGSRPGRPKRRQFDACRIAAAPAAPPQTPRTAAPQALRAGRGPACRSDDAGDLRKRHSGRRAACGCGGACRQGRDGERRIGPGRDRRASCSPSCLPPASRLPGTSCSAI